MSVVGIQGAYCILACAVANFAYQALTHRAWEVAAERSFFQASAIAIFVFVWLRDLP